MENLQIIRNFIDENFLFGDDDSYSETDSLIEQGIVDSTGILELVNFIGNTFDIMVKDEEVVPENFDSLYNILNYIKRKRNGSS